MNYPNSIQISQNIISLENITRKEPQNSHKSKTTIIKINSKKNSKELYHPTKYQNLNEYRQQNGTKKYNTQANIKTSIIRNSISSTKSKNNLNNNNNRIIIRNQPWLNKYFIYRHESLNNYLFKEDFRKAIDKLSENFKRQLEAYRKNKPIINRKEIHPSNISLNSNLIKGQKNTNQEKTFIVTGGYSDVVKNLTERGWVRQKDPKNLFYDYIWTLKTNEINFMQMKDEQMANHFFRNGQITRKSGLCKNIKNLYYLGIDPMNFFPRCYDLSIKTELEDFKQDFKFTWTISILIMFLEEYKEKGKIFQNSQKFTELIIQTCINIINRNCFLLEENGPLKDINNLRNSNKIYLISDNEWNTIYLPELTQNSNIQDIIFEVNSNKPGGINNPIKGKSNTVQKKIISKPNGTKNYLMSMPKNTIKDTNNLPLSFPSVKGLKNQINKMNLEENKNNNYNQISNNIIPLKNKTNDMNLEEKKNNNPINNNINTNNNKKIIRKKIDLQSKPQNVIRPIKIIQKPQIKINDGALFKQYIPQVESLVNSLKQYLPQFKLNGHRNIWILKPSNLSRGRGVTCVNSLEPIEQSLNATNDTGVIVQKYIENPLIINKRKFDIRQWVLVTSLNPLVIWMWKEPYLRFGAEDYIMDDLNNIYSHLTNNSIAKHSNQYKNEKNFNEDMWTCFDFVQNFSKEKWEDIHEKIKNAIICSFYSIRQEIKARANSHELYGYDFMIDEDYNVYLIEVNASPALDYSTKITEKLVKSMVKDLIELVIDYNNARDYDKMPQINKTNNKFIQIFNETKDRFDPNKYLPNRNLFH